MGLPLLNEKSQVLSAEVIEEEPVAVLTFFVGGLSPQALVKAFM